MLILQRRPGEETKIGGDAAGPHTLFDKCGRPVEITVTILGVIGNQVRIGFEVPKIVPVHRDEIYKRIKRETHGDPDGNVQQDAAP